MLTKDVRIPATVKDLPGILGGSIDFWYDQVRLKRVPHYKVGNRIFFTLKNLEDIRRGMQVPVSVAEAAGLTARSRARHQNKKPASR